jgi:hypothetical protein
MPKQEARQLRDHCPECGQTPQLLAGCVMGGIRAYSYLVCWDCGMVRCLVRGAEWTPRKLPTDREAEIASLTQDEWFT